ncbi:MAG TPA: ABC transporter ATP-binding protein [Ilumatobacteraceae bacterium]|nr:ABC transporter ATP-binding protein [Ilumatobacteraceae bacterium]
MSLDASIEVRLGAFELDVELSVEPGEVLAVLGPNGSGKSTLLRALGGLLPIDRGTITIDGTVLDDPGTDTFVPPELRPIGVVFQDHLLFAHMSALENVAFGLRSRGVSKAAAHSVANGWLDRVGLAEVASLHPTQLSGGQAQRVALARALAVDPALLLLDEPLAALDVTTRQDVRRSLREHLSTFDGVRLLVTHDPIDAYALADRIAILERGRIAQIGTIAEVTAHPRSRYVAELVGTNLVRGVVTDGVLVTDTGARIRVAAESGPVFAVIRPQAITLSLGVDPNSSARNVWSGIVGDIDRLGDRARVVVSGPLPVVAEITTASLDALGLRPGDAVHAALKATDIATYPA